MRVHVFLMPFVISVFSLSLFVLLSGFFFTTRGNLLPRMVYGFRFIRPRKVCTRLSNPVGFIFRHVAIIIVIRVLLRRHFYFGRPDLFTTSARFLRYFSEMPDHLHVSYAFDSILVSRSIRSTKQERDAAFSIIPFRHFGPLKIGRRLLVFFRFFFLFHDYVLCSRIESIKVHDSDDVRQSYDGDSDLCARSRKKGQI